MTVTISEIIWAIDALLAFICGVRIYQAYRNTQDKAVGDYAKFFTLFGFGFVGAVIADPIMPGEFNTKLTIVISLFVMFSGMAYLARMATALAYPKFEKQAFWTVMIGNILTVIANLKYYLFAPTRAPFLDPNTGMFVINFPVIVTILVVLIVVFAMFVPGIVFIRKALNIQDKAVRARGMLLGSGLILFAVGFMACGAAKTVMPMQISHLFIASSYLPFLVVTFYAIRKKVPEAIPTVQAVTAVAPKIRW